MSPSAYTKGQLVEQPAIQLFAKTLPRLLSGQVKLADLFAEVLP